MEASHVGQIRHVGGLDILANVKKVGKISSNWQMYASEPNIWKPTMMID